MSIRTLDYSLYLPRLPRADVPQGPPRNHETAGTRARVRIRLSLKLEGPPGLAPRWRGVREVVGVDKHPPNARLVSRVGFARPRWASMGVIAGRRLASRATSAKPLRRCLARSLPKRNRTWRERPHRSLGFASGAFVAGSLPAGADAVRVQGGNRLGSAVSRSALAHGCHHLRRGAAKPRRHQGCKNKSVEGGARPPADASERGQRPCVSGCHTSRIIGSTRRQAMPLPARAEVRATAMPTCEILDNSPERGRIPLPRDMNDTTLDRSRG